MAQSIKLNNDVYWDVTGLYGVGVYSGIIIVPSQGSITLDMPANFKGFFVSIPIAKSVDGFGMYGLIRQGATSGYQYIKPIVDCTILTATQDVTTSPIVIHSSSSYPVTLFWFGNNMLGTQ